MEGYIMKYEWKKQEKNIYGAKKAPCVIDVSPQKYITLSGIGNPNDIEFSEKVSALYSLAYKIKMAYKSYALQMQYEISDYTVYPLEGIWSKLQERDELVKEELKYKIMIRQPEFISEEMFTQTLAVLNEKKPQAFLADIALETIHDGKVVQMLHIGSFDDEPKSFEVMDLFCKNSSLERISDSHREIYLNNANRTEKSKLKTILRYAVK